MAIKAEITTAINNLLEALKTDSKGNPNLQAAFIVSQISDGYHTFEQLYQYRMLYNALLFNEWVDKVEVGKSKTTNPDGTPLDGNWFVVWAFLPNGMISNHYPIEHWELFKVPEVNIAVGFDGHTSTDVVERIINFITQES